MENDYAVWKVSRKSSLIAPENWIVFCFVLRQYLIYPRMASNSHVAKDDLRFPIPYLHSPHEITGMLSHQYLASRVIP